MQQANKVAGDVTGSGLSGRSRRQQSGGLVRKPGADGRTRYEYEAEDSEVEDGMGVSQEEWESEVGGRIELPTGLEKTLTAQILHTYETRLFPSAESIEVKRAFIEKFAAILTHEFPGVEMDIHVFGSSVNGLGTSRSDVDICLTTERRELENIFVINKALRRHGMRTYCIPYARVPLVKAWDPELRVASDINVNSTIALHNTRMIQTFVAVDSRVRPFVMAVKHWTKTRELNDAAFGGTLSPYAWVNLALHFLQTRSPPILPVLHPPSRSLNALQSMHDEAPDLSFNDNIHALRGFGLANTESLGFLLYAFFRTYAYEFDYRHQVVSLRHGCTLTKAQKGWDFGRPARIFCIEEPFLTWLNLGHSANTTSVVGIRMELKRAFQILRNGGSFDEVCEVYQRPQRSLPLSPVQSVSSVSTAVNGHRRTGSSSSSSGGSGNGNGGSGFATATRSGLRRAASLHTDKNTHSRHHDNSRYQQQNHHRYNHFQDHQDQSYYRQQEYYSHMPPGSAGTLADAFERVSLTPSEDNEGMDIQLANASDATLTAADYERLPSSYSTGYCLSPYGVYHSTVPLSQKHDMQRRESYDSTAMYCPADVAGYSGAPRNRSRQPIQHWHATPSHIYAHQQRDGYNHNHNHHHRAQSIVGGPLHHAG
ncbi:hypothetical protein IWW48_001594 [Coemansia sp. RSA 1200]|nr:hypothetical protein IWW48_001594 [Coemansia sp. RSA 1200]